jgi:hypothetical protein
MPYCPHCGSELTEVGTFCSHCGKTKPGPSSPSGAATAVVSVQKTESEKTFLLTNGATVTNSRIIVPGKTYAMAGITSVRSTVIAAKRGWAIITAVIGLILLGSPDRAVGVLLLIVGIIWAASLKDNHAVTLSSASGEVHAVISKDSTYIANIVQAVNEAIVYRN